MKSVLSLSLLIFIVSCADSGTSESTETEQAVNNINDSLEIVEYETAASDLFLDRFASNESLSELEDKEFVLSAIGAFGDVEDFYAVVPEESGYRQACDVDYNGILSIAGGNGVEEFFGFKGFFYEISDMDTYYLYVNSIDVNVAEQKLVVDLNYYMRDTEGNGMIDHESEPQISEIWKDDEFGTIIVLNNRYFMAESIKDQLPTIECPEYEP